MRARAFTLVELIAVIVVLAILAGIAAPRFFDAGDRAQRSAAKGARAALVTAVEQWRVNESIEQGTDAGYPPNLDDVLATQDGNRLLNPYHDPGMPVYNIDPGGTAKLFMYNKTIEAGLRGGWGSIWYNPNNGRVAFRVPEQSSSAATIELFNDVNQSSITSLTQTTQ